ncbi:site-specific integrase [Uliginosibacterium gangwonense]|uniref:site-specific integrase n=1 Tax=Uliginosibacterium gangwonense TaxID=392736 RepID=UPI0003A3F246|nr:site-specific integrase [Uliginosibacterium gangwonense]
MGRERKRTGVTAISSSSIQITFTYKGVLCRERIKLQPTAANLTRAEQHRGAIMDAIARGTFDYAATFPDSPKRFLFSEKKGDGYLLCVWLESWIDRQRQFLKDSTWDDYRKIVFNILIPAFGKIALSDIKRSHIREWCEKQQAGNKRLANIQGTLRRALQDALDDDLMDTNPLHGWKFARREAPKLEDDVDPFSADEQEAILKACANPQYRNLIQFAFWSGLRTSELVALEWRDIDFGRGLIRVQRAKTQKSKMAEGTKTRRGTREVKLLPAARRALEAQKPFTFQAGEHVFINPRTQLPWRGDQPIRRTVWIPALKLAGVRYRRPYQTRHTYASMMLTAGESPIWISAQMGHADTSMIFRNYGRWITDAIPNAGGKAAEMFDRGLSGQQD